MAHEKGRNNMVPSIGYCYSEISPTNHMVSSTSFEPNPEIMEILGFPQKMVGSSSSSSWHNHNHNQPHDQSRLMVDDASMRCVFPCEGNERPSQGLSLSLNSSNPSTIGLQSFELRQQQHHHHHQDDHVDDRGGGYYGNKSMNQQQENMMMFDGLLGKGENNIHHHQMIRNSKYLGPAQELLYEFCNLGTNQPKMKPNNNNNNNQWQLDDDQNTSITPPSLSTPQLLEFQQRKTKLFSMLEEVDRRYRHYCDQMKAVVSSFEAVAGTGAATVYSAMASRAMSRHFRCLRDGIVRQIKATKKAMGEKETVTPGGTRGETPRLRLLEQTMRQHRAFQQRSLMESHPWRPQRGLPERSVSVLRAWLFEHFLHPYPSDVDKHILARQTGLSRNQVSNWFINARVRLWKPMVEEMYLEETKDEDNNINNINNNNIVSSDGTTAVDHDHDHDQPRQLADQKPTPDQLLRIDSECLSSIIINNNNNNNNPDKNQHNNNFGRFTDAFGAMELDFETMHHNFGRGAGAGINGGVSLTLGLQQHGGVNMAHVGSTSVFYPRGEQVEYSLLESEGQNLNYRNLMGAQLLHEF